MIINEEAENGNFDDKDFMIYAREKGFDFEDNIKY